jgi:hypothetical protein
MMFVALFESQRRSRLLTLALVSCARSVGAQTAAYLIAELGDPARFYSAASIG